MLVLVLAFLVCVRVRVRGVGCDYHTLVVVT